MRILPLFLSLALGATTAVAQTPGVKTPIKPGSELPPPVVEDRFNAILARAEVQAQIVELSAAQVRIPETGKPALRIAYAQLLADPGAQAALALRLSDSFSSYGFTDPSDDQIARVAATILPGWSFEGLDLGLARLPLADQRALLQMELRVAESLTPDRCASFLSPWSLPEERQTIRLSAIAAMPATEAEETFALAVAATLAEYRDSPPFVPMSAAEEDLGRQVLGAAVMAAVDADPDPDRLLRGLAPMGDAPPEDRCAAQVLVLRSVLALPGADGDLALRLVATYGLSDSL